MASPYSHSLQPITDISKYFKKNDDFSMTFIGETLELRIPMSFKKHGLLLIGETVDTPGIMDMIFDDKYQAGLNLLASITIEPSDMTKFTYDRVDYQVLKLVHGNSFMSSYRVLMDPHIVYVLWTEWITKSDIGYWITYDSLLRLFEHVRELTGSGIGVSRSVYEGIIAHIARDPANVSLQYRLTDMTKPMQLIALNSISQSTTGTVAKLNGSYFTSDGLTSALRYEVDEQQPFENILRGILFAPKDNESKFSD